MIWRLSLKAVGVVDLRTSKALLFASLFAAAWSKRSAMDSEACELKPRESHGVAEKDMALFLADYRYFSREKYR